MDWILEHWHEIGEAALMFIGAASLIIKLTPTLKDDSIWLPIVRFLGKWVAVDKSGPKEVQRPQ